jgi:hypothetical protein
MVVVNVEYGCHLESLKSKWEARDWVLPHGRGL